MNKKHYILTILFALLVFVASAQITITTPYPVAAQPLTRGLDTSLLTVDVQFAAACANTTATVAFPASVTYVAGSVAKIGGTAAFSIAESNISNLSAPIFSVNAPSAGTIRFTVKRIAGCGSLSNGKDTIKVSGACGTATENDGNINTYNILAPSISVLNATTLSNVDLGVPYNRNFTVTNGGNGCLDTLFVWVKYPAGSATLNSLKLGATTLTASFTSSDSSLFKIFGANLPGGDNLMCNGESLIFTENVTFKKCNVATTYGAAWNQQNGTYCQQPTLTANITMSNNLPTLVFDVPNPNFNACFTGDVVMQRFRVRNTGAGAATNIKMYLTVNNGRIYQDTTNSFIKDKDGNVLGRLSNFEGVAVQSRPDANCVNTNRVSGATGNFGDIIIAPGDSVFVDVPFFTYNFNCSSFCGDILYWMEEQGNLQYKNQCGAGNYATGAASTTLFSRAYDYLLYSVSNPTDINGYAPNNAMEFKFDFGYFTNTNHPSGSGQTYMIIPGLSALNIAPAGSTTTISNLSGVVQQTVPMNVVNDTLWIGPFTQNRAFSPSTMKVPVVATCGTGGVKTATIKFMIKYDGNCANEKFVEMGCKTVTWNQHCPAPCPKGGATPTYFTLRRINYGQADNDNNGFPDAAGSLDMSKVNQQNVVNKDTVMGTWNVKVYPNSDPTDPNVGQPFTYTYLDFNLGTPSPAYPAWVGDSTYLTALPNALVTIYPAGGGAPITCTVTPTVSGSLASGVKAHYDFNSCRSPWQSGDSMVIKAKFVVNGSYHTVYAGTASSVRYVTNNNLYSSYNVQPVAATNAAQIYSCDTYNDYLRIIHIALSTYERVQNIVGCSGNMTATVYTSTQEYNLRNTLFPFEYRYFFIPDEMYAKLPAGFTYRANSAVLRNIDFGGSSAISDVNVSQTGTIIKFSNLKNLFTPYGGTLIPADEYSGFRVEYNVDPTCDAVAGFGSYNTKALGVGNGVNTPATYPSNQLNILINPSTFSPDAAWWADPLIGQPNIVFYDPAQPNLSGGGLYTTATGAATWTVALQNASTTATAPNSWFYISPINSLSNIVVKEGATTIAPDANGFYRLSTLVTSANRSITITANTTTCNLDSMRLNYGYGCTTYPNSFSLQSCTKTLWLKADSYPSQVQLAMVRQPGNGAAIAMCATDSTTFVLNSAQAANLANPYVAIYPPTGVNVVTPFPVEYPLGSGTWYNLTPVAIPGGYRVNLYDIAAISTSGLPGTVVNPGVAARQAKVKIAFSTTCDITSGSAFEFYGFGNRPCGQPAIDNGTALQTTGVDIIGATSPGTLGLTINTPTSITCGQTVTLSLKDVVVAAPTQSGDTVTYSIPSGLSYVPASFANVKNCASCVVSTAPGAAGSTLVKVALQSGVAVGDSLKYTFNVTASGLGGCTAPTISASAKRTISGLTCGATTCTGSSTVVGTGSNSSMTVQKPTPVITAMSVVSGLWWPGQTPTVSVTIRNDGAVSMPASAYYVEFFCGTSTTPMAVALYPSAVPAGQTVTANMTFTVNSGCPVGSLITAKIREQSALGSPQCICSETSFTFLTPLPVDLESFTASEADCKVALNWKVAAERNLSGYEVEFSNDGVNFNKAATVAPKGSNSNYRYNHTTLQNGTVYYRLRMVDIDGKYEYSNVLAARVFCAGKAIVVYPNPANSYLQVTATGFDSGITGKLYNSIGQLVMEKKMVNGTNKLETSRLADGTYNLVVSGSDGSVQAYKVLIKH